MLKLNTTGAAALTFVLLSGTAIADSLVYSGFPVTVNGYSGKKTTSVAYTGQIARHVLHDSLKKLSMQGNGKPNPELKGKMLSYFKNKDKGFLLESRLHTPNPWEGDFTIHGLWNDLL